MAIHEQNPAHHAMGSPFVPSVFLLDRKSHDFKLWDFAEMGLVVGANQQRGF